jgi:gliding motility-associated-like protein
VINPIATPITTTIDVNGTIINTFPTSISTNYNEFINLIPNIDPAFTFGFWSSDSNTFINGNNTIANSFYGLYNDTIVLHLTNIVAEIYGNDTLCSNEKKDAELTVYFKGNSPYNFGYELNGEIVDSITTNDNPYIISTSDHGLYTLNYFQADNENGATSGQANVTVLEAPIASFEAHPDSMSILYTITQIEDKSIGSIVNWEWHFGDDTEKEYLSNPTHTYKDSVAIYEITLIVEDNMGCQDTTYQVVSVNQEYWIFIPNSFTPDNDQLNDKFCISYNGIMESTFVFNVYNRFSNLVYSTNKIIDLNCENNGWDGKHQETGRDLPSGVYLYEIYYQDFDGWKHQETGNVFIVR